MALQIGSYAVEQDYSHYISYAAKTTHSIVGTATKGPMDTPTLITSVQDLVNKFGPLKENFYALYAAHYFLSQSSRLYFTRVGDSTTLKAATATIDGKTGTESTEEGALTIGAKENGTYYNDFSVELTETSTESGYLYTITVKNPKGLTVEVVENVPFESLKTVGYETSTIKVTAVKDAEFSHLDTTNTTKKIVLAGGTDGIEHTTTTTGNTTTSSIDYTDAFNALKSNVFDFNLMAIPGESDTGIITDALALATTRGDFLLLIDPPKGYGKDDVKNWVSSIHEKVTSTEETIADIEGYGAVYYNWVTIYDSVNKKRVSVPPSVTVASSIAYSDRVSELWYAPAGLNRGLVRGVLGVENRLSKSDIDELYNSRINCLYEDPQAGLVIWGQKTLYQGDSALNRINVRRLMNYLKKTITAACDYLTFEPNDSYTWNSFEMKVAPVLESVKARRGLYEYRIIKGEAIVSQEDIDNYRMPCMIMIRPTKTAEEIPIYFAITSTGADFNEVLDSTGLIQ